VFAGPQSDRDGVQQTQSASTKSSRANHSASLTQDRRSRGRVQSASVRQLLPTCRLRFHVTGIRSNWPKTLDMRVADTNEPVVQVHGRITVPGHQSDLVSQLERPLI